MKAWTVFNLIFISINAIGQTPSVSGGTIRHFENFESRFVMPRNIDVWLPKDYSEKKKYAVLYMHDGKGLYDSTIMWNKQEWGVDETISKLTSEKKIKECIVVGIWNSEATRHLEYFPQKPFESLTQEQQEVLFGAVRNSGQAVFKEPQIKSDAYLKFIIEELKPFIDKTFSTRMDQQNTFIAGSSMGGLISMYAICEYPEIFGGAACLSTHWPGTFTIENNPVPEAFMTYLRKNLPSPKNHKIYFDYGTETLDALYKPLQQEADKIMVAKGYSDKNWITREFIGENHSEKAWNKRLDIPLTFLLGK